MTDYTPVAKKLIETLNSFTHKEYWNYMFATEDLLNATGDIDENESALIEARLQKGLLLLVKSKLDKDIALNQEFKDKTDWNWLNRLLTAARLKELASVKITVKGRRAGMGYEIVELVRSYYGRSILKSLNFNVSRRKVVTKEEFKTIQEACAKIKLKLPEVIQPTTTELFFEENNKNIEPIGE